MATSDAYNDDDEEELPKRPRLSLPIDEEFDGDDDDLQPHRSAGLEDITMHSVEMPRRALSEQPGARFSLGSVRMSDYFGGGLREGDELRSEEVGIDSGFFPPLEVLDEGVAEEFEEEMRYITPCAFVVRVIDM